MKRIFYFFIIVLFPSLGNSQSIHNGSLTFESQMSIHIFKTFSYCDYVTGDVIIDGSSYIINDLSGLTELDSIGGSLIIRNTDIPNFTGLGNIVKIGKNIIVENNPEVENFSTLSALETISDSIIITSNTNLLDYCSLSGIAGTKTENQIVISQNRYNPTLNELTSNLCSYKIYTGDISFGTMADLKQFYIDGYQHVIGDVRIDDATPGSITDLNDLRNLKQIDGDLHIIWNYNLSSLEGLEQLDSISGILHLNENKVLESLSGLNGLVYIGNLIQIGDNDMLTDFCALSGVAATKTPSEWQVVYNPYNPTIDDLISNDCSRPWYLNSVTLKSQEDVDNFGANNFDFIDGDLTINDTAQYTITSLSALESLDSISGSLTINTTAIQGLQGFSHLIKIDSNFVFANNPAIESLINFLNLATISDSIIITDNNNLKNYCSLSEIISTKSEGQVIIEHNKYNPTPQNFSDGDCSPRWFNSNTNLYSQMDVDNFGSNRYTFVNGNITIIDTTKNGITDLSDLVTIDSINGSLTIKNTAITNLYGLQNLKKANGNFVLENNPYIESFADCYNLEHIGDSVITKKNSSLHDYCELSDIIKTKTEGLVVISENWYNPSMEDFKANMCFPPWYFSDINLFSQQEIDDFGVNNYTYIQGNIRINDTANNIVDLSPLNSIDSLGNLSIAECNVLKSMNGFENLQKINFSLQILQSNSLSNLDGFSNLSVISGDIKISENLLLSSLDGLENLEKAENVYLEECPSIRSLDGLQNLQSVNRLYITNCSSLESLGSLSNLDSIKKSLYLYNNDKLNSIELNNLKYLEHITIANNDALTSLDGMENITGVVTLNIGVTKYDTSEDGNKVLTDYCAIQDLLETMDTTKVGIQNNAWNPSCSLIIEETKCRQTLPVADAGNNQDVLENTIVSLDASGSYDDDGDLLEYFWTAPNTIALSNTSIVNPTFNAPDVAEETTFTLTLMVFDGYAYSTSDSVEITVTPEVETGVYDIHEETQIVYPNPVSDELTIKTDGISYEIININGKVIKQGLMKHKGEKINIFDISNGIYVIRIKRENDTVFNRVVVTH